MENKLKDHILTLSGDAGNVYIDFETSENSMDETAKWYHLHVISHVG